MTMIIPNRSRAATESELRPNRISHRPAFIPTFVVIVVGLFAFAPVYWVVVTSVTPSSSVFKYPPDFWPQSFTLAHFINVFRDPVILKFLLNSFVVAALTAILSLFLASYAAYSFSKFRYRGRASLMYLILSAQMFPQVLLLITLYLFFSQVGLLDTYFALVVSFSTFTLPLCVWMLKGFFDAIPDEVIEAAKLDGASQFVIIHRILIPIAIPGLMATGLFAFLRGWNDLIFALTLASRDKWTLPPGLLNHFVGEFAQSWPELMAASIGVSVPLVVIFMVLQRRLIAGLAAGSVRT